MSSEEMASMLLGMATPKQKTAPVVTTQELQNKFCVKHDRMPHEA
jgi:hypothetical protein